MPQPFEIPDDDHCISVQAHHCIISLRHIKINMGLDLLFQSFSPQWLFHTQQMAHLTARSPYRGQKLLDQESRWHLSQVQCTRFLQASHRHPAAVMVNFPSKTGHSVSFSTPIGVVADSRFIPMAQRSPVLWMSHKSLACAPLS